MGYYIQTPGFLRGKVAIIVKQYGATIVNPPVMEFEDVPKGKVLICVLENPTFEAAAVIYDQREYDIVVFDRSGRRRTWLLMHKETAFRLARVPRSIK